MNSLSNNSKHLSEQDFLNQESKKELLTVSQFLEQTSPGLECLKTQNDTSLRFGNSASNSFYIARPSTTSKDVSVDLTLLKQTIVSLISEMNEKNKEKFKKKEKLKQLESLCEKNKKKIKKMKGSIKEHEEKIIMLERKLNNSPNSLPFSVNYEKNSPRSLLYDKSFIPKASPTGNTNLNLILSTSKSENPFMPKKKESPRIRKPKNNN